MTKEDIVPRSADKLVHFVAPLLLVVLRFLAYAVLPVGRNMVVADLDAGVLYFFAVGAVMELSIFMAGMVEPEQVFDAWARCGRSRR